MTSLRQHIEYLRSTDQVVDVSESVHWDGTAADVASEAIRHNCPVVRFEETPGTVQLVSGVYGGPGQFSASDLEPWQRILHALGWESDHSYVDLLERLAQWSPSPVADQQIREPAATVTAETDLYDLGLPTTREGVPLVSLGVIAVEVGGVTMWAPVSGRGRRSDELYLSVPRAFSDRCPSEATVSVLLGIPGPALLASLQAWTQGHSTVDAPALATGLSDIPLAAIDSRTVPADGEVRLDGRMIVFDDGHHADEAESASGCKKFGEQQLSAWELACETTTIRVQVRSVTTRENPIVPFTPRGEPLTDDVHLLSLIEAAELFRRVNNYWGVSPVKWIQLPVAARFGLCIASIEVLYAGFEWQLANALFSFSDLFDKVLVLDEQADPTNLSRAIDDMWVKAHPANDWVFSNPNASRAAAPVYNEGSASGSRLYINATWDPRWDEEYIAPRVTLETAFSDSVLSSLADRWDELGLAQAIGTDRLGTDDA